MTLELFTPNEHQEKAIAQILRDKRTLVKGGTGAGKTLVGVEAMLRAGTKINLIVAPINTYTGWAKTLLRQSKGEHVLRFIDARKAGKEAHEALASSEPGFYFVGTERMRTQTWYRWDLDFIVHDECHRATNRKSANFQRLDTMRSEYKLALSATPFGNKVEGAWAIARWLWPKQIDESFWRWGSEYLMEEKDEYSYKKFLGERNPGAVWSSFPSAVKMPSVYTDKPAIHEIEVELSATQRKHYKELERDAITFLEEHPLATDLPSVKYIRLLEILLATPSIKQDWIRKQDPDTGIWETVWGDVVYFEDDAKSSKADALLDLLSDLYAEKPTPVLVYTHSKKFATFLTKRLQSKGYEARQFIGGMSREERNWKLSEFGKQFDIMVCTIQAISEGTDGLQDVAHTEVWMSVSDNRILNTQCQGRLSRQGQTELVNRYVVRARGTVETDVQHPRLTIDQSILDSSYQDDEEDAA